MKTIYKIFVISAVDAPFLILSAAFTSMFHQSRGLEDKLITAAMIYVAVAAAIIIPIAFWKEI
jgi:hypothetical protein